MTTLVLCGVSLLVGVVLGIYVALNVVGHEAKRRRDAEHRAASWESAYNGQCVVMRRIAAGHRRVVIAYPSTIEALLGTIQEGE